MKPTTGRVARAALSLACALSVLGGCGGGAEPDGGGAPDAGGADLDAAAAVGDAAVDAVDAAVDAAVDDAGDSTVPTGLPTGRRYWSASYGYFAPGGTPWVRNQDYTFTETERGGGTVSAEIRQWGGKSSRGIDCSGLVQVALRAAGHQAMRDTDMQAGSLGREVDREAPRARGDIVYFPGHVGIMLDGGHLLHANAWSMTVAAHPLAEVVARIAATHAEPVTCVRRL